MTKAPAAGVAGTVPAKARAEALWEMRCNFYWLLENPPKKIKIKGNPYVAFKEECFWWGSGQASHDRITHKIF